MKSSPGNRGFQPRKPIGGTCGCGEPGERSVQQKPRSDGSLFSPGCPLASPALFMYARRVPDPSGPLWEELERLVDPTLDPPLIKATIVSEEPLYQSNEQRQGAFRVGSIRDTGEYHPRPDDEVKDEVRKQQALEWEQANQEKAERYIRIRNSSMSLEAMGFQFVEPGDVIETLGGEIKYDEGLF